MRMSGGKEKDLLARLKKINCHRAKTLLNHIKRVQSVARMWKRADETDPTGEHQNCLEPDWFPGSSVPETLTCTPADEDGVATSSDGEESESDNAWSDDSDDSDDCDEEL